MRWRLVAITAFALVGGACGGNDGTPTAAGASSTTAVSNTTFTTTMVNGKPHFGSPEAAMTYLADAWNRDDLVDLKHVTDPSARDELNNMHGVAVNLRLNHCEKQPEGDYMCHFDHDYPAHASTTMAMHDAHEGIGEAIFRVGPADTPGWYMTVFESCS